MEKEPVVVACHQAGNHRNAVLKCACVPEGTPEMRPSPPAAESAARGRRASPAWSHPQMLAPTVQLPTESRNRKLTYCLLLTALPTPPASCSPVSLRHWE